MVRMVLKKLLFTTAKPFFKTVGKVDKLKV